MIPRAGMRRGPKPSSFGFGRSTNVIRSGVTKSIFPHPFRTGFDNGLVAVQLRRMIPSQSKHLPYPLLSQGLQVDRQSHSLLASHSTSTRYYPFRACSNPSCIGSDLLDFQPCPTTVTASLRIARTVSNRVGFRAAEAKPRQANRLRSMPSNAITRGNLVPPTARPCARTPTFSASPSYARYAPLLAHPDSSRTAGWTTRHLGLGSPRCGVAEGSMTYV